jgi:hypothetical protein
MLVPGDAACSSRESANSGQAAASRPERPPLMIRCCEDNRRSDGGRRPWKGNHFTRPAKLVLGSCRDPKKVFPWTPPPADPTLARIGGTTVMFHGDHTRGIFPTVLRGSAHSCFAGPFVR